MTEDTKLRGPDLGKEGLPVEALDDMTPSVGHFEGKPVVLVREGNGLHAVGGRCTHYGGPLGDGLCAGGEIHCPWHHASFDIVSGAAVGAPALDPIPSYDITVRDGRLYVLGEATRVASPKLAVSGVPESVVIVGAGAAGAAAAERLRSEGYEGPIHLVGEEAPVDRPNLSKDYLAGTAPEEWMPLRTPEFYAGAGINLSSARVESVDPESRKVRMADGDELSYGALVLATGAEPRRLPVPGAELSHVHYLRSLADSRAIISALGKARKAVVIGAGFIGLEVAASLRQRDVSVTVVAPEEMPLAHLIGETLGRFVTDLHRQHGVDFELGSGVKGISAEHVELDNGRVLPADVVVVGIGVLPRTQLAEDAGLTVDNGIVVNDHLRTSDPNIWAAGDIARYPGPDGNSVRVEHWAPAQRQGQTVAGNILGRDAAFIEPPFFWSQHYDVPINVTGHLDGWDKEMPVGDPEKRDVLVGFWKAGRIAAIASIYRDGDSLRAERALAVDDQGALVELLGG